MSPSCVPRFRHRRLRARPAVVGRTTTGRDASGQQSRNQLNYVRHIVAPLDVGPLVNDDTISSSAVSAPRAVARQQSQAIRSDHGRRRHVVERTRRVVRPCSFTRAQWHNRSSTACGNARKRLLVRTILTIALASRALYAPATHQTAKISVCDDGV